MKINIQIDKMKERKKQKNKLKHLIISDMSSGGGIILLI